MDRKELGIGFDRSARARDGAGRRCGRPIRRKIDRNLVFWQLVSPGSQPITHQLPSVTTRVGRHPLDLWPLSRPGRAAPARPARPGDNADRLRLIAAEIRARERLTLGPKCDGSD